MTFILVIIIIIIIIIVIVSKLVKSLHSNRDHYLSFVYRIYWWGCYFLLHTNTYTYIFKDNYSIRLVLFPNILQLVKLFGKNNKKKILIWQSGSSSSSSWPIYKIRISDEFYFRFLVIIILMYVYGYNHQWRWWWWSSRICGWRKNLVFFIGFLLFVDEQQMNVEWNKTMWKENKPFYSIINFIFAIVLSLSLALSHLVVSSTYWCLDFNRIGSSSSHVQFGSYIHFFSSHLTPLYMAVKSKRQ